jgi:hypothetical protein
MEISISIPSSMNNLSIQNDFHTFEIFHSFSAISSIISEVIPWTSISKSFGIIPMIISRVLPHTKYVLPPFSSIFSANSKVFK